MVDFKIIEQNVTEQIVEKKSKFIANIFYIENIEQAENILKDLRKKYYDARHNCYAYRVVENGNIIERSSDDGEPSGTAGAPMLNIISKNNISNILVVVTRYFGGILLGTGGLVRAYSKAAQDAIDKAEVVNKVKGIKYKIFVNYENQKDALYWCKKLNIEVLNIKYDNLIELNLQSTIENKEQLLNNIKQEKDYEIVEENVYILDKNL